MTTKTGQPRHRTAHPRLAVLVSGTGTIFEAMLAAGLRPALVLADRPCRALDVATAAGLPTVLILRTPYGYPSPDWDRPAFTAAVQRALESHHITLVAMSGFMTVLSPPIFDGYPGRILNTHPSLLPAFPGPASKVMRDTLAAGVTQTGCTIMIATAGFDQGPILAQERVPVLPTDTPDVLQERIKVAERRLYPLIINRLLSDNP